MKSIDHDNIKLNEENTLLKKAVEELAILNDVATAITSTQTLDKIIELIVQRCIKHLNVSQGAVMILEETDSEKPFQTVIRRQDSSIDILPYRFDTQLTGWMLKNKAPLLINDIKNDERFSFGVEENLPVKSILSVPMTLQGKMIGLVTLFNKKVESGFSDDDKRLLAIIAAQSAHVLENARLLEKEKQLVRLEEEYRMAKEIQVNLLPKEIPKIDGYDIYAINIPAREVGGDYYDFIQLPNSKMVLCLGDITGKGLPAAMLMANLQATLRGQALMEQNIKAKITNSNKLLYNSTSNNRFATLFYSELDYVNHTIRYCNAGHDLPVNILNNNITRVTEGGLLLGCFDFAEYEEGKKSFEIGELLAVFSDGIGEAMNEFEEEYGEEKLIDLIKTNVHLSSKKIVEIIINEIKNYSSKVEQSDDITIMIIKRDS